MVSPDQLHVNSRELQHCINEKATEDFSKEGREVERQSNSFPTIQIVLGLAQGALADDMLEYGNGLPDNTSWQRVRRMRQLERVTFMMFLSWFTRIHRQFN
ncbi:hypothetical protein V6N13_113864 [Hibiscus sabdariffa]|uniref:Uncharacterized protein n=1 Tax=Hibiscus sabdariffa TaxID=183260 RepID=A0ABR2U0T4_9ROSI